jgi:hypothetical protein
MSTIICPIGTETINLNVSRTTVFLNVILMAMFFITLNPLYIMIVLTDYFIRAFLDAKYSPLRYISATAINMLNIKGKKINLAQKVFASRLGMLCALAAIVFFYVGIPLGTNISLGMLLVLSFADSVFNLCVGCLIYNHLVYPFYKNK